MRIERDVLQQYGLTIDDDLTALKAQFNDKIKEIQGKAAKISSAAYFDELIERITLEKAQKDADSKP
ncbi:hypothetical protein, partial [Listeria monocytogenes]|uniref:hypothetical protein n=1 Tax=Listeria monocytogenes TaxID=1639 RepID=UPI002FDBEFAD